MLLFNLFLFFLFISLIVVAFLYIYIFVWTIITNRLIENLSLPIGVENIKTGAAI